MHKHTFGYASQDEAKEAQRTLSNMTAANAQAMRVYESATIWNLEFQTTHLLNNLEQRTLINALRPSAWRIIFNHLVNIEESEKHDETREDDFVGKDWESAEKKHMEVISTGDEDDDEFDQGREDEDAERSN